MWLVYKLILTLGMYGMYIFKNVHVILQFHSAIPIDK